MSVSLSEVLDVKNFLRQQHIMVSEEWSEACISFVRQEMGHSMSIQNVKKNVHQQWLVADLEEIACPSLPENLPTVQKITLNNNFALQVQGIRDISRPAYAQLKQIKGAENANEEFTTAPKASVPDWEAKPNRMLLLNLTDGCTQIQGMEYKPINFLSPNLPPGVKVLIKAPVDCRFGMVLLSSDNISILGGEVENKLQQFSRETILKEVLQIQTDETDLPESGIDSVLDSTNQELPNNVRAPHSYATTTQESRTMSGTSFTPSTISPIINRSTESASGDILDDFESDDDFDQNIDYGKLDEIENSQRPRHETVPSEVIDDECDIWQEDEDMVRDMMEFQDQNLEFEMPFELNDRHNSSSKRDQAQMKEVFSYLSTATSNPSSNCTITIKGFILTVLSKLECTPSKGWSLTVKINDGTSSVNAIIHDKVLENIIGVSAQEMMKKQVLAAKNAEVRKEVMQTISKCKVTLQNYNCLMDVKFTPGESPCIVKCCPVNRLHVQQLLDRVRCHL